MYVEGSEIWSFCARSAVHLTVIVSSVFLCVKSQSVTFHTCLIRSELKLLQLHTLTHSIWSPVYNDIYYSIHFCKDLSPSRARVRCLHSQTNQEDSPGTLSVPPHSLPVQFLLLVLRLFTPQKHSVIIRMHLGSFLSFLTATSTAGAHRRLHKMWCWFFLKSTIQGRAEAACPPSSVRASRLSDLDRRCRFIPHRASFKLKPLQNCCIRCSFQFVNLLLLCLF